MKDVDVKVTERKVVDAEEVVDAKDKEPVFVEVKPASVRQYWKSLSFKKKLGLVLGTVAGAAASGCCGYFIARAITSKVETAKTLELPSDVIIENEISKDEVE